MSILSIGHVLLVKTIFDLIESLAAQPFGPVADAAPKDNSTVKDVKQPTIGDVVIRSQPRVTRTYTPSSTLLADIDRLSDAMTQATITAQVLVDVMIEKHSLQHFEDAVEAHLRPQTQGFNCIQHDGVPADDAVLPCSVLPLLANPQLGSTGS